MAKLRKELRDLQILRLIKHRKVKLLVGMGKLRKELRVLRDLQILRLIKHRKVKLLVGMGKLQCRWMRVSWMMAPLWVETILDSLANLHLIAGMVKLLKVL